MSVYRLCASFKRNTHISNAGNTFLISQRPLCTHAQVAVLRDMVPISLWRVKRERQNPRAPRCRGSAEAFLPKAQVPSNPALRKQGHFLKLCLSLELEWHMENSTESTSGWLICTFLFVHCSRILFPLQKQKKTKNNKKKHLNLVTLNPCREA